MNDTDTTAAATATEDTADTADTTTTADTNTSDTTDTDTADADEATPASREAAKYRKRLRAVESERDQLAARLEHLQRGEAERIAAAVLADGADLWKDGATIAEMVNDDGHLDSDKVAELARTLTTAHPHWSRRTTPKPVKTGGGMASGASNPANQITATWASVLRGSR